ncbi:MAG: type II restriction endonuclease [Elusimicrobiota bacterium]
MNKTKLGSKTAKGGFANEKDICKKFNNWIADKEAKEWLEIMGYNSDKIDFVKAIQIPTRIKKEDLEKFSIIERDYSEFVKFKKADAQIKIIIKIGSILKIENLSLKKVTIKKNKLNSGFNQVDKRWIDAYQQIWHFDNEIALGLKLFTGEIKPPKEITSRTKIRDKRRLYLDELPGHLRDKIVGFLKNNKILIVSDILKGRGGLSADWMLVTRYDELQNITTWTLKDINMAMNFFGYGDVTVSKNGSLHIGKISMQRKGGDAGRPTANMLQFKFKPCELFEIKC